MRRRRAERARKVDTYIYSRARVFSGLVRA
nr:MAG TPA: hypothetical protein [Caudoviricetes sp.]